MKYKYSNDQKSLNKCDVHLIGVFTDKKLSCIEGVFSREILDNIKRIIKTCNFTGKNGDHRTIDDFQIKKQILLFGLGEKKKYGPLVIKKTILQIFKKLIQTNLSSVSINVDNLISSGNNEVTLEMIISSIENSKYTYKFKDEKNQLKIKTVSILSKKKISSKRFSEILKSSLAISSGISLAKELGNTPPNICTPTFLASSIKKLKSKYKSLKVKIIDEPEMKRLGMGAFLSVSKGSKQPGKIVIMEHMPIKSQEPIVIVGKGITFDTGGISLKPSPNMDEMKYDMSGAGSVIGVMKACVEMNLKKNVVGVITSAENMPGSQASRPGDVVQTMSGLKVEILNTDAEGRLVLCDAITYAKKYKPKYLIDVATLTGACLVGLGKYPSGLFSNNQTLANKIKSSGDKTGDRVWQLPLYDDYFDELKTNFADIQNIGGRYGGAITAAAFLAKFTQDIKWAHLDIAGTAWEVGPGKGSTGRPVDLLIDFIRSN
tara:strand:+ start:1268 stop:2731 length:1464 start_codon:yes stop_codon:yes gene_type:complete